MSDKCVNRDCADEAQVMPWTAKGMNCVAPPVYIVTTFQVPARPTLAMKKDMRWTEQPLVPGKQPAGEQDGKCSRGASYPYVN